MKCYKPEHIMCYGDYEKDGYCTCSYIIDGSHPCVYIEPTKEILLKSFYAIEQLKEHLQLQPILVEPIEWDTCYENYPEPERYRYYYDEEEFKEAMEDWINEIYEIAEVE